MIKIHTVEWTPAILNEDFIEDSVIIEWFGRLSDRAIKWLTNKNITVSPKTIKGHIGHPKDLKGVNFSMTEEFVAAYRMHPLLPDYIDILAMDTGKTVLAICNATRIKSVYSLNIFHQILIEIYVESDKLC